MSLKQSGYEFWNSVLNCPKFVAAPMVDMSELSFRMLCRQYNADVCFSPMLHSQQFLQDYLYRQDTFSSCLEDRPLIIQFCANDPAVFVSAASMVSSQCDAIDLNLGCPQAIAKKGCYGAFLQDDWNLVHSIVRKAASELAVPVTCKMRILTGHIKKSVEFSRMLESAGCSVITVHGRTREQKGHATGLASWDVIKEIKANVNIPIIANGNILSFKDIESCLEYTGADAVMSAEALLHNPALFSGKNPAVWDIVEQYLHLAEKYGTPIRYVRCHLFKILYLCIHHDDKVQQILAEGSSFEDFYSVCDILKNSLAKKLHKPSVTNAESQTDSNDFDLLNCNEYGISSLWSVNASENFCFENRKYFFNSKEFASIDQKCLADTVNETEESSSLADSDVFRNSKNSSKSSSYSETYDSQKSEDVKDSLLNLTNYLPIWQCHSRPRLAENEKTRGCYSKYIYSSSVIKKTVADEERLSKKKLRRMRHHERVLAAMKEKRKTKKLRRKQKMAETKQNQTVEEEVTEKAKITKKQRKLLIKERLLEAQGTSPKICINLGFSSEMEIKELHRLSSQLRRLYGSNRHSITPLHLYFCSFATSDPLYQICLDKNDGFSSYVVEMTEDSPEEMFNSEDIIYLSPDAENVLRTLDHDKVYVIGGIVDGSVKKGLSLSHAKNHKIQTARLPITEHLVRCSENPGTTVLTVNQVFDILLKYYETKDWITALSMNVPQRKGYCAPSQISQLCENMLSVSIKSSETY